MERVSFITVETGEDLILSFAVQCGDDPIAIESLILMRTPKYEFIFEEYERGVKVSFERYDDEEDELLQAFAYVHSEAMIRIRTPSRQYQLDVRKVDADDLKEMFTVLKKMNFDRKFQTSGV